MRGLGRSSVCGASRFPRPAASSTALTREPSIAGETFSIRQTASKRMRPAFTVRTLPALHLLDAFERLIVPLLEEQG
jgi:hypothetical protein